MSESLRQYPDRLEVRPWTKRIEAVMFPPGSKSITNRAFILAALNRAEKCVITSPLESEDTQVMLSSLGRLGYTFQDELDAGFVTFERSPASSHQSPFPARSADLFVANSGTSIRFLTALVSLGSGRYRLDGVPRMRERPLEDLLVALRALGVDARSENDNGCPPVVVNSTGLNGGHVQIKGDVSSQFVSALLMVAPHARGDVTVEIDGPLVSEPYVAMTVRMMKDWGFAIQQETPGRFRVPGRQIISRSSYRIEPDASGASYWWAAAAITGSRVAVPELNQNSLQGDLAFLDVLARMGCRAKIGAQDSVVTGGDELRGIDVDMNAISDQVMTLAAVACFAKGPTTIRNVAHIRHKESDRIAALATELRRVGAEVEEFPDGLKITPRQLRGAEIETYDDHRMAMSMALIGLKVPGIVITNPGCVAKTYPGFWDDLEQLQN
jgi:3-phosphoshikimate 1-carboxyvinyltransferase